MSETKTQLLETNPDQNSGQILPARLGRWLPHLVAFSFYTALTLLIAWPVVTNLGVGTPGHFPVDRNQNLWNMWWFRRSLFETGTNPFSTDFLFYPYGAKLYLHTYSPLNLIIGLPLQLLFGIVPAYGLLELLTFPLGGYGGYLLARHLAKNEWGALLAGLVWSFGPYHWVELRQDQQNLLSLQWIPFFILFMLKLVAATERREIIKYGLAAGLFYLLTIAIDYYYAIYLLMFAGLYWLWQVGGYIWQLRAKAGKPIAILTAKLAGAFGLGLLPYSPVLYATVRETTSPRYAPLSNVDYEQIHSADLLHIFFPPAHQPWWGGQWDFWGTLGLQKVPGTPVYLNNWGAVLGYVAVVLSFYALFKVRGLWFWAVNALFWILLSFGPSLRVNGQSTSFPMPYRWLMKLPFVGIGRFPERFMLMAQLSFGILAAFALAAILPKIPAHWGNLKLPTRALVGGLLLTLFMVESWAGILAPPDPISQPDFTKALATNELKPAAIFEFPVTKHSNPDSPRMLSQIYHKRPITGGYISRDLLDPHRVANDHALYDWLEARKIEPDIVPAKTAQEQFGLLNYANMRYVVFYKNDPAWGTGNDGRNRAQQLIDYTWGKDKTPIFEDETTKVYQVPVEKLTKPVLVLGKGWGTREGLAGGTGSQRWIDEKSSEAHINIVVGQNVTLQENYTLEIEAVAPGKPRRLQICLNGSQIAEKSVDGSLLRLDGLKLKPGDNILTLRPNPADGFFVPAENNPQSKDTRQLRIAVLSVKLS